MISLRTSSMRRSSQRHSPWTGPTCTQHGVGAGRGSCVLHRSSLLLLLLLLLPLPPFALRAPEQARRVGDNEELPFAGQRRPEHAWVIGADREGGGRTRATTGAAGVASARPQLMRSDDGACAGLRRHATVTTVPAPASSRWKWDTSRRGCGARAAASAGLEAAGARDRSGPARTVPFRGSPRPPSGPRVPLETT
jgi:hypothetical protein